jgi:DNA-binding transcriptional MerR regulator
MLAEMFTVSGFARLAGVSPRMLRAYDVIGLFAPAWVDPSSGYRYYTPAQLPKLRRILALRDVGLSRAEIGDLVCGGADLGATLARRRADLEAERREVERRLAVLDIRIGNGAFAHPDLDVVVRHIGPEPVATFDLGLRPDGDVNAAFYELETHLRDIGVRAHRPPGEVPDERLVFVPVRRPITPTERIGFRRLAGGRVATVLHHGRYESVPEARQRLVDWAAAAGHEPTGALRILYLQFGAEPELRVPRAWTVDRDVDFVTELQLPV